MFYMGIYTIKLLHRSHYVYKCNFLDINIVNSCIKVILIFLLCKDNTKYRFAALKY